MRCPCVGSSFQTSGDVCAGPLNLSPRPSLVTDFGVSVQEAAGESVQAILTALEACTTALHVASQPSMPQQARSALERRVAEGPA